MKINNLITFFLIVVAAASGCLSEKTTLITRPKILLLDEPFSSLDYVVRMRLRRDLKKLREIIKIPIILITHNPLKHILWLIL